MTFTIHFMNLGELLFDLNNEQKRIVNSIIRSNNKVSKATYAIEFNKRCLDENILPKYSNIHLDPASSGLQCTLEFRRSLVENQLRIKEGELHELQSKVSELQTDLDNCALEEVKKVQLRLKIDEKFENSLHSDKLRIVDKLKRLYQGDIKLPEKHQGYINLSSIALTKEQDELLNLGLNCHLQSKRKLIDKKTELEILYQDILQLESDDKVCSVRPSS